MDHSNHKWPDIDLEKLKLSRGTLLYRADPESGVIVTGSASPPEGSAIHPLYGVLMEVIDQVSKGKGERHGGDTIGFNEQPWRHYARLHGRGFLTGQAAKKLEEAASKFSGQRFEHEVLGAIAYAAMAILWERDQPKEPGHG